MFSRSIVPAVILAAACGLGAATLVAQNKSTVWTKVTAEGNVVSLVWDKDHPWDRELSAGGVQLLARYSGAGTRDVAEVIAKGVARGGNARTATFTLPDDIRGTPQTSVCLFFQLPNRRVLPVRQSSKENTDTAGFRYEPWEQRVRERAALRDASTRVSTAERALAVAARNVESQRAVVSARGWTGPAACDALATPRATAEVKPYGVVPPEQQDDIARRVCVHRVWEARDYADAVIDRYLKPAIQKHDAADAREVFDAIYSYAFMVPDAAGPLLQALKQAGGASVPGFAAREAQAAEFLRDWNKYGASSKDYEPHFGRDADKLGWVGSASEVAMRVHAPVLAHSLDADWVFAGQPQATADDARSLIGIALDAYGGCVADGKVQLKLQYDNWESLQSSAPQRAAAAAAFFAKECRQGIDLLDKLNAEQTQMQAQLAREQAAQRTAQGAASSALPTKTQELNTASCGAP